MPVVFKVKLGETGHSLRISVPKPIIDGFGWKKGDELELVVTDKEITLRMSPEQPKRSVTGGTTTTGNAPILQQPSRS